MASSSTRVKKRILKVIVIGDSHVGKTSLNERFIHKQFSQNFRSTIGADLLTRDVQVNDMTVTLQIWDTAGQERFHSLGKPFYRGADCCVLVFDVNVEESFNNLKGWKREFLQQADVGDSTKFPFVVLGNKVDFPAKERQVSKERAEEWCAQSGMRYYETSAKDDINVTKAFIGIAQRHKFDDAAPVQPPTQSLQPEPTPGGCAC